MSATPAPATPVEATQAVRTRRRIVVGKVVSDSTKMQKTLRVSVDRAFKHPKYEKRIRRTTIYVVHDERNEARIGDQVEIVETRPLSKTKRWRLVKVLKRSE